MPGLNPNDVISVVFSSLHRCGQAVEIVVWLQYEWIYGILNPTDNILKILIGLFDQVWLVSLAIVSVDFIPLVLADSDHPKAAISLKHDTASALTVSSNVISTRVLEKGWLHILTDRAPCWIMCHILRYM